MSHAPSAEAGSREIHFKLPRLTTPRLTARLLWLSSLVLAGMTATSLAGSATWAPTPASAEWNVATNWEPATVPNANGDIARFGQSTQTTISLAGEPVQLGGMIFDSGASAFRINITAYFLYFYGSGIINNSGALQTLAVSRDANGNSALLTFYNASSAGSGTYIENGGFIMFNNVSSAGSATFVTRGSSNAATPPRVSFYNTASGGSATFINEGSSAGGIGGGSVEFNDSSSAANATFTLNGGTAAGAYGGEVRFWRTSSAGNATFTVNGSPFRAGNLRGAGGFVFFVQNASAGNATFTLNGGTTADGYGGMIEFGTNTDAANATLIAHGGTGGSRGGNIDFRGAARGGSASVRLLGNATLDISYHDAPGVSIGSLEGSGTVFLGGRELAVGTRDTSTHFSGLIRDGGVNEGTVGGSLTKIGSGTLTLSGANTYTGGTNIRAGSLIVSNTTGSATGSGRVVVEDRSVLGGNGAIGGAVAVKAGAVASAGDVTTAAGALILANDATFEPGSIIELGLGVGGQHSRLVRSGGAWSFADGQAFRIVGGGAEPGFYDNVISGLAADPGNTASWTITTPRFAGTFTYDGAGGIDLNLTEVPAVLGNISTRLRVQTGDNVLIGGFIINGAQPKRVIVRGIGPSLNFAGALQNPTLEIFSGGTQLAFNDNWIDAPNRQEIIDTQLAPTRHEESAIVMTLPPGAYTAVMRGVGGSTGIGVVEAYDIGRTVNAQLANISTRGFVETGDNAMIGGFIVLRDNTKRVLIRATGPSLPLNSKLGDPVLELYNSEGVTVRANDNWRSQQAAEIEATGLAPADSLEPAILTDVGPGAYTAIVRGVNDTTGVAVVEIYALE